MSNKQNEGLTMKDIIKMQAKATKSNNQMYHDLFLLCQFAADEKTMSDFFKKLNKVHIEAEELIDELGTKFHESLLSKELRAMDSE